MVSAHYRSHVEFCFEALDEAARRLPADRGFLERAGAGRGEVAGRGMPCADFVDRDGRRPRHAGCGRRVHDAVREGNRLLADGDSTAAARRRRSVRAMLDVLGLDPADPALGRRHRRRGRALTRRRRRPRRRACSSSAPRRGPTRTCAAPTRSATGSRPPASRSRTPPTARSGASGSMARSNAGNSQRKGAIKKTGKGNPTAGSGRPRQARPRGQGPDAQGQGPAVPQGPQGGEAAPSSAAAGAAQAPDDQATDAEWIAGRNSVVEALRAGRPGHRVYVAEGAERDGRLREVFKIAAEQGISPARGHPQRARPDDRRRRAPGTRRAGARVRVRPPDDLLDRAAENGEQPLIVALDSVTDPRNLGAVVRCAAGFGAHGVVIPERRAAGMTATPGRPPPAPPPGSRSRRPST